MSPFAQFKFSLLTLICFVITAGAVTGLIIQNYKFEQETEKRAWEFRAMRYRYHQQFPDDEADLPKWVREHTKITGPIPVE